MHRICCIGKGWHMGFIWGCARDAAQIKEDPQGMVRVGKCVGMHKGYCTHWGRHAGGHQGWGRHGLERVQRGSFLPPSLPHLPFSLSFPVGR